MYDRDIFSKEDLPMSTTSTTVKGRNQHLLKLVLAAMAAALAYVVFTFLQIKIPLPGGDQTSIHLGNAIVVLGAQLLGGVWGGIAGAIGLTIGDLFDPIYITSAPITFIIKFGIGLITGLVAHKIGKITKRQDKKQIFRWALLSSIAGLLFNLIFDPLLRYFYKILVLGKPAAELTLAFNFASTGINAVVSVIVATALYMALRPALEKAHLLPKVGKI